MREYPKTTNLLERDPDTHKCVMSFRRDDFGQIAKWHVTEEVDGTNIRILFQLKPGAEGFTVDIRGRSDRASLPGDFATQITNNSRITSDETQAWLRYLTNDDENVVVCLYGEGYGAGIQKIGSQYRKDKGLRIFDVTTTRVEPEVDGLYPPTWWRPWSVVQEAADVTGLKTVPVIDTAMTTEEVIDLVRSGELYSYAALDDSENGDLVAEGVVARTDPYLFTWNRERVMFKLKGCDL